MNGIEDPRKVIVEEHPVLDHHILEGKDTPHDVDEERWIQHHPIHRSLEGLNDSHTLKILCGPLHFLLVEHTSLKWNVIFVNAGMSNTSSRMDWNCRHGINGFCTPRKAS